MGLRTFIYGMRLNAAIKKADKVFAKTRKRQYVMPILGTVGKLWITDRQAFRKMKQHGRVSKAVNMHDLQRECFYHTPHNNGTGAISPDVVAIKRKQFFKWMDYERKIKGRHFWQIW